MRASIVAFVAGVLVFLSAPALAEKRVALVVGNGAYRHVAALPNPGNDASDIAASLERLGFSIRRVTNGSYDDMRRALLDFSQQTRDADMAVVFFAGHGMEIGGENWLIPIDARLQSDVDAEQEAVGLKSVLNIVARASKLGLVILDACRNNPFAAKMTRTIRTRSVDRGFARVEPTDNVLVAYAAKDGTTAADGSGRNSPFTASLLKHLETPGLEVRFLLANVRDDVIAATKREQQPFMYGSLSKELIFFKAAAPAPVAPPVVAAPAGPVPDEIAWGFVKDTKDPDQLRRFIEQFPASARRSEAAARLLTLEQQKVAVVAPPVAPAPPPQAAPKPAVGVFPPTTLKVTPLSPERERALKPKDSFKECDACPEMIVVPAGSFMMGSPAGEAQRHADEGPQHRVTFARPFAVGRFAVTFAEWDACVSDGGCSGYNPRDAGWGRGRQPLMDVSWEDAKAYLTWLSRKTGKSYRLLSESEREYVTRAGTTTPYWWGASISPGQANYNDKGDFAGRTVPVDSFQPNPWGLYQVHGNVYEWVEDCYHGSYVGAPSNGAAWTAGTCRFRVLRGGNFHSVASGVRSAFRDKGPVNDRHSFRVARTLAP